MSILLDKQDAIRLVDDCPLAEAEILVELLSKYPGLPVDWSACSFAHTAVIQVLLAHQPVLQGRPRNNFLTLQLKGLGRATDFGQVDY